MKAHAFGFSLRASAPESQKRFPIIRPVPTGKGARHVVEMGQAQTLETTIDG